MSTQKNLEFVALLRMLELIQMQPQMVVFQGWVKSFQQFGHIVEWKMPKNCVSVCFLEFITFVFFEVVGRRMNVPSEIYIPSIAGLCLFYSLKLAKPIAYSLEQSNHNALVYKCCNKTTISNLIKRISQVEWIGSPYCSCCDDVLFNHYFYFETLLYLNKLENGRRVQISRLPNGRFTRSVYPIRICPFCVRYQSDAIFFDALQTKIKRRNLFVKRSNLERSLMMQRFLRKRIQQDGKHDITQHIMSFLYFTPTIELEGFSKLTHEIRVTGQGLQLEQNFSLLEGRRWT